MDEITIIAIILIVDIAISFIKKKKYKPYYLIEKKQKKYSKYENNLLKELYPILEEFNLYFDNIERTSNYNPYSLTLHFNNIDLTLKINNDTYNTSLIFKGLEITFAKKEINRVNRIRQHIMCVLNKKKVI